MKKQIITMGGGARKVMFHWLRRLLSLRVSLRWWFEESPDWTSEGRGALRW